MIHRIFNNRMSFTLHFLGIAIIIMFLSGCQDSFPKNLPIAKKGTIDLSNCDFSEESVLLSGEWELYWKQLLTPDDFDTEILPQITGYIHIPRFWDQLRIGEKLLSSEGYATYRLNIDITPNDTQMMLWLNQPLSVAKIWINGRLVGKSGDIGTSIEDEHPKYHSISSQFINNQNSIEIIIQMSNFHNNQGGLHTAVSLGDKEILSQSIRQQMILVAIFAGAFLVIGLFHISQYFIGRMFIPSLYFGLYCILMGISTAFGDRGVCLVSNIFSELPWHMSIDFALIPHGIMTVLLVLFYHSLFPYKRSRFIVLFYLIVAVSFIVYIVFTPANAFDLLLFIFRIIFMTIIPYLFYRFFIDLRKGADGIRVLIPSYLFFGFTMINDILYDIDIIQTTLLRQYATVFLILSYSFLIALRLSQIQEQIKTLSKELMLRKKTENKLRQIHQRLSEVLGFTNDAILAINTHGEISFCNTAFEGIIGCTYQELLGELFQIVIDTSSQDNLLKKQNNILDNGIECIDNKHQETILFQANNQQTLEKRVTFSGLEIDEEMLLILIISNKSNETENYSDIQIPIKIIEELNKNRSRLLDLEMALAKLPEKLLEDNAEITKSMANLDTHLMTMLESFNQGDSMDKRSLGAKIMNLGLDYWMFCSKTSKIELAEQSGVWSVYYEKDGFARTQTMDKYFNVSTLPEKPRWKNIINTAMFVLRECKIESPLKKELEKNLDQLRQQV